jgi:hypothetical protein
MVSPEMAATLEMAELAAQVLTERPGLMVRLLANPGLPVKPAATAERADWLDSADWQAALERQLARMVLKATAATLAAVGQVATVPLERMGRFRLQTVRPAAAVAMAGRAASAERARRLGRTV